MSVIIEGQITIGGGWFGTCLKNTSTKDISIVLVSHTNITGCFAFPYYGPKDIPAGKHIIILSELLPGEEIKCAIKTTDNTIKFTYSLVDKSPTIDKKHMIAQMFLKVSKLITSDTSDSDKTSLTEALIKLQKLM